MNQENINMKKALVAFALCTTIPLSAYAANNNIGTCGWGSKLFDGQAGIAPQVLGATTNGTSGNQTFAISSGTSGCTQDGVVKSNWKTAAYVDGNMNRLARDMSRGEGESLNSLASLLNVREEHGAIFKSTLKQNFSTVFSSENSDSESVLVALNNVLSSEPSLAEYTVNI
jgi:hypothetical protein